MPIVLAMILVGTVHAREVAWTYVEGCGSSLDPDRGDREEGWFVGGSR